MKELNAMEKLIRTYPRSELCELLKRLREKKFSPFTYEQIDAELTRRADLALHAAGQNK